MNYVTFFILFIFILFFHFQSKHTSYHFTYFTFVDGRNRGKTHWSSVGILRRKKKMEKLLRDVSFRTYFSYFFFFFSSISTEMFASHVYSQWQQVILNYASKYLQFTCEIHTNTHSNLIWTMRWNHYFVHWQLNNMWVKLGYYLVGSSRECLKSFPLISVWNENFYQHHDDDGTNRCGQNVAVIQT